MNLYNFYHIYADGVWPIPLAEYIDALKTSRLDTNLTSLYVGIVGSPINRANVIEALKDSGINFTIVAEADTGWEQVTLNKLYEFSQVNDGLVLYSHTKGASDPSPINVAWRRSMVKFLVYGWSSVMRYFKNADAVGCHWLTPERDLHPHPFPFFAGTFWWATLSYVRTLGYPDTTSRWDAEIWIGKKYPRVVDLFPGWPSLNLFK